MNVGSGIISQWMIKSEKRPVPNQVGRYKFSKEVSRARAPRNHDQESENDSP